jgi:hypothetical protein
MRRATVPAPPQARCPATGRPIALPVAADWSDIVEEKAIVTIPVCPPCGNEHAWRLDEVFAAA